MKLIHTWNVNKVAVLFFSVAILLPPSSAEEQSGQDGEILQWLQIKPAEQSLGYVNNQKEFQLHTLKTEQRHPKTWSLSFKMKSSTVAGLEMLLAVDEDVSAKMAQMAKNTAQLEQAAENVEKAICEGRKIYVYGCGATGRLAKQMESSFWRPFWKRFKRTPLWPKVKDHLPTGIEGLLIGEMTGGDRALISSLEGFEDLQLIGELQLKDRKVQKGDVVFCVTEGGETSSVIGTVLAALKQYGPVNPEVLKEARNRLYFIYNNPDEVLLPFQRSRAVIENPGITKVNLFTGPQAITGSTRMQATTSETFVMGVILEHAIQRLLGQFLSPEEFSQIGFGDTPLLSQKLLSFIPLQREVWQLKESLAQLTDLEAETYAAHHLSTYFAARSLITVFIDSTERSPTFRLYPLDTAQERKRKCWIQVWTVAENGEEAWQNFLGRPFYGLDSAIYEEPFMSAIGDPFLREAALRSLKKAGHDQQHLYDFSFAEANLKDRSPQEGDLGVMVVSDEEIEELTSPSSPFCRYLRLFQGKKAHSAVIMVGSVPGKEHPALQILKENGVKATVALPVDAPNDPLFLKREVGLKMLLNAHSTAVMAKLGRVIGNTMTSVNPGNLKLIGRATFLIQSHVNDVLTQEGWAAQFGKAKPVTYGETNAVLFDTIEFQRKTERAGETAEVGISVIRILEAYKKKGFVANEEAFGILQSQGLEAYLLSHNPSLK